MGKPLDLRERVRELEAEVEQALRGQAEISGAAGGMHDKLSGRIATLEADVNRWKALAGRLRAWVSGHEHWQGCEAHAGDGPCTCGKDSLLADPYGEAAVEEWATLGRRLRAAEGGYEGLAREAERLMAENAALKATREHEAEELRLLRELWRPFLCNRVLWSIMPHDRNEGWMRGVQTSHGAIQVAAEALRDFYAKHETDGSPEPTMGGVR